MAENEEKKKREREVFQNFSKHSGLSIDSFIKYETPYPDIVCELTSGETIEFELTEECSEIAAKMISDNSEGRENAGGYERLEQPSEIARKIAKEKKQQYEKHKPEGPVELLISNVGRNGSHPAMFVPMIQYAFCNESEPFRRVWYMDVPTKFCALVLPLDEFYEAVNRWGPQTSMWEKMWETIFFQRDKVKLIQ